MKRSSERQITKDDRAQEDDSDESGKEPGTFERASQEVLSTRKIVKVRRAGNQPHISAAPKVEEAPTAAASANPFAAVRLAPTTEAAGEKPKDVKVAEGAEGTAEHSVVASPEKKHDVEQGAEVNKEKVEVGDETKPPQAASTGPIVTEKSEAVKAAADKAAQESPAKGQESPAEGQESSAKGQESPAKGQELPNKDEKVTGAETEDGPKFTFGSTLPATSLFAASGAAPATSVFSSVFKSPMPTFSFSTSAATFTTPGFQFGTPSGESLFSFSAATAFASGSAGGFNFGFNAGTVKPNAGGGEEEEEGDDATEFVSTKNFKPVVTLEEKEVSTGEEDEEVFYKGKSKVYELEGEKGWKERGTGVIKLNVKKAAAEKGKEGEGNDDPILRHGRILMRTEGSLRVVLNASLFPQFQIQKATERSVRFVVFGSDKKPTSYLAKLSSKDEVEKLLEALERWKTECVKKQSAK